MLKDAAGLGASSSWNVEGDCALAVNGIQAVARIASTAVWWWRECADFLPRRSMVASSDFGSLHRDVGQRDQNWVEVRPKAPVSGRRIGNVRPCGSSGSSSIIGTSGIVSQPKRVLSKVGKLYGRGRFRSANLGIL